MQALKNPAVESEGMTVLSSEDLRDCVNETRLVCLCLEAAQEAGPLQRAAEIRPGRNPAMLLTLLTYSYSAGLYGSREIARRAAFPGPLRYLSAGQMPAWYDLARFRRGQRPALRRSLAALIQRVAANVDAEPAPPCQHFGLNPDRNPGDRQGRSENACWNWADERIRRAMLFDSMDLDE